MNTNFAILAASFENQFSPITPFLFYVLIGAIIFIETGVLLGFFLPGDSILFSAGLVAATRSDTNIVILISIIFLAAFMGDQALTTVTYSSKNHLGRNELWGEIQKLISEKKGGY